MLGPSTETRETLFLPASGTLTCEGVLTIEVSSGAFVSTTTNIGDRPRIHGDSRLGSLKASLALEALLESQELEVRKSLLYRYLEIQTVQYSRNLQ